MGDLCISIVPASPADKGLYVRGAYLNGDFQLWRVALLLVTGLVGMFFYAFGIDAISEQILPKYRKTRALVKYAGLMYVASAATLHFLVGTLAYWVTYLSEHVSLVRQIIHASQTRTMEIKNPSVLALVGPSGSGKDALTKTLCQDHRFVNPKTYCTKKSSKHHYLTKEQFAQQDFFERTMYAGVHYGTKKEDIQAVLDDGKYAVMSLDMCGAIAMKRHFPTAIIYVAKDKEDMIADIVQSDFPVGEKTLRLLSLDAEKRNREICDFVIDNRDEQG